MCVYCGTADVTMTSNINQCYYGKRQADRKGMTNGGITKAIHRSARRLPLR